MKKLFIILAYILLSLHGDAQSTEVPGNLAANIDTIQITRGDKRFFEAEYDLQNVLRFKEVSIILDSAKTLTIEVTFSDAMGTMLKIFNPFSAQLIYKAELYSYKKKSYLETSTVPVYPKLTSFETWPYKIDKLQLTAFKLTKTD
jgi:hypothetical protein